MLMKELRRYRKEDTGEEAKIIMYILTWLLLLSRGGKKKKKRKNSKALWILVLEADCKQS